MIAYFADANPWELAQKGGHIAQCTAVSVWMETARKLIAESTGIFMLVNPEILKKIDPTLGKKENKEVPRKVSHGNPTDVHGAGGGVGINEDRKESESLPNAVVNGVSNMNHQKIQKPVRNRPSNMISPPIGQGHRNQAVSMNMNTNHGIKRKMDELRAQAPPAPPQDDDSDDSDDSEMPPPPPNYYRKVGMRR